VTRVRGKEPLKITYVAAVEAEAYSLQIRVKLRGNDNGHHMFDAEGVLCLECAKKLIVDLRRALRTVRDEATERLNRADRCELRRGGHHRGARAAHRPLLLLPRAHHLAQNEQGQEHAGRR
jgi:hypothetical protein